MIVELQRAAILSDRANNVVGSPGGDLRLDLGPAACETLWRETEIPADVTSIVSESELRRLILAKTVLRPSPLSMNSRSAFANNGFARTRL